MVLQNREQIYNNIQRTISGTGNTVEPNDYILNCDTSAGPVEITLLEIPTGFDREYKLYVIDASDNASTNDITIIAPAGHLINGKPTYKINVNKESTMLRFIKQGEYLAQIVSAGSPVLANHVFVDAHYGNDDTGEYGNVARPFKTIGMALGAVAEFFGATDVLSIYDFSVLKETVTLDDASTVDIHKVDPPMVNVKIAPGFYNSVDDWAAVEARYGVTIPLDTNNNPRVFNLMLPYISYDVSPGATLYNYGFYDKRFWLDWTNNTQVPCYTRVTGKGIFYSDRFINGPVSTNSNYQIDLEYGSKLTLDCELSNLGGNCYSAELRINARKIVFENQKVFPESFNSPISFSADMFYVDDFAEMQQSIFRLTTEDLIHIRRYNERDGFSYPDASEDFFSGVFLLFSGDVEVNIDRHIGMPGVKTGDIPAPGLDGNGNYETYDLTAVTSTLGAIGYEVDVYNTGRPWTSPGGSTTDLPYYPAGALITYAENYQEHEVKFVFNIGTVYTNTNYAYLAGVYEPTAKLDIIFNIKEMKLAPWPLEPVTDRFIKTAPTFTIDYNEGNANVHFNINRVNSIAPLDTAGITDIPFIEVNSYVGATPHNVIINNLSAAMNVGAAFGYLVSFNENEGDANLALSNIVTEFIGSSTNTFINADLSGVPFVDIRVYQNCYCTDEISQGQTIVTNLIPGTDIIIDPNVKAY